MTLSAINFNIYSLGSAFLILQMENPRDEPETASERPHRFGRTLSSTLYLNSSEKISSTLLTLIGNSGFEET
jgi:hypothetical protein